MIVYGIVGYIALIILILIVLHYSFTKPGE